ncbi:hypothetical protein Tco_1172274, partial [Tanacetum coccineum]
VLHVALRCLFLLSDLAIAYLPFVSARSMLTLSQPFEDFRETEIPQPLPIASSPVPPSDDPYLVVGQAHTPAAVDTESEPEEALDNA